MRGIFGQISSKNINLKNLLALARLSEQRGKGSSGLLFWDGDNYQVLRANQGIIRIIEKLKLATPEIVLGFTATRPDNFDDDQPVVNEDVCLFQDGIVLNDEEIWSKLLVQGEHKINSEVILAIVKESLSNGIGFEKIPEKIFNWCKGVITCSLALCKAGKLLLFSNNGSLYGGYIEEDFYYASQKYFLEKIGCSTIFQIGKEPYITDIPLSESKLNVVDEQNRFEKCFTGFNFNKSQEKLLEYKKPDLKRCTRCILPETMPFISFDEHGVCNYCRNYKPRNNPNPREELLRKLEPYRRAKGPDCIVPFSGGRDSSYALHVIVKELGMKAIAYTYDWGMATELARRNISLMCGELGVEHILVASDISKKRKYIRMNLKAWLKSPNLGLISLLTAGDKHFFKYIEHIKKQTGVDLNIWGTNPLEVTHFKAGFLGIPPDFEEKRVYMPGIKKQLRYHIKRFKAMSKNLGFFNESLWDTLSGEYYRSFKEKKDYYHLYDYWKWDEKVIDNTLSYYGWEKAADTKTTWRVGDGTSAFYNYIYYTVGGFTENDTFRSNQIRENQLTRDEALKIVEEENRPRYQGIKWYLDILDMDFEGVIKIINSIPKLYKDI